MTKRLVGWVDNLTDNKSRISLDSSLFRKIGINDVVNGALTPSSSSDPCYPGATFYSEDWNLVGIIVGQAIEVTELSPDFADWVDICNVKAPAVAIIAGPTPLTFTPLAGINYIIRASTDFPLAVGSYTLRTVSPP